MRLSLALLLAIILASLPFDVAAEVPSPANGDGVDAPRIIVAEAPASTGLTSVVVADNLSGDRILFSASSDARFSRWDGRGAAFSDPVPASVVGSSLFSVMVGSADCGLTVSSSGRDYHFWIIDYSAHALSLSSLDYSPEASSCGLTALILAGDASPIPYVSINGVTSTLSRELSLTYSNLQPEGDDAGDASSASFSQIPVTLTLPAVSGPIEVDAPLCATNFTLEGDRFSSAWGDRLSVSSSLVQPVAVSAITSATQSSRDIPNEQSPDDSGGDMLGGSAPVDITFSALPSDAASFREWQISRDPEFFDIDLRYATDVTDVTFSDQGTFYVRYVCADPSGECEFISETYTVAIGESLLLCPNAFSPLSSPGVNDEWRVSYKSIVDFNCVIVNRWGNVMAKLSHPSQGWDGRHSGKLVPAGVYFYIINARGADGRVYNLRGDINIIGSSGPAR